MEALLILGGLLLILAGLVWLVMRAFSRGLLWGLASLLPPLTLWFVARHWAHARGALMVVGLGFAPLIVGLAQLAHHDAQRFEQLISLRWLYGDEPAAAPFALQGELAGRPFRPQRAELIDGTLRLREGEGLFASRELVIELGSAAGSVAVDVLPDDGGDQPEIRLAWLEGEAEQLQARRLSRGYTLHLNLSPQPPNRLVGELHLVLPPQFDTRLSGTVEVYTDRLRYVDGRVDRSHDSDDTLAYVVRDYLQRRYQSREVELLALPRTPWPVSQLDVRVEARVAGRAQTLDLALKKEPRGWAVADDRYPELSAAMETRRSVEPGPSAAKARPVAATAERARPQEFSLERLLAHPTRYEQLQVRAHTERGGVAEGRFHGLDAEGRLNILRRLAGPGEAVYALAPGEIVLLELLEP